MTIIRMKYTLLDEIARYATGHLPEEACGLIAGSEDENGRFIEKVYYLTNVDHAEDHFTLDPKEQLSAIKDMRETLQGFPYNQMHHYVNKITACYQTYQRLYAGQ